MASKLVILAAAMAALVVITHASVITNDVIDNQKGRCRRAELRSQWPDHCEQYMMQGMMRYRDGDDNDDDDDNQMRHHQYFDQCCDDLQRMEPECQCEAMKMMVKEMKMSQGGRKMPHQMVEKAMEIPMMCGTMQHKCRMSYMQ